MKNVEEEPSGDSSDWIRQGNTRTVKREETLNTSKRVD